MTQKLHFNVTHAFYELWEVLLRELTRDYPLIACLLCAHLENINAKHNSLNML